jgi:hypothetical protein
VMAKQPKRETETIVPRSQRLFDAGFKTRAHAERCIKAIISDLAADRIGAMKANELTNATLRAIRDFGRKRR